MALINSRIKDRRQQLGLTLLQIADFLGVKEATAQRYESGDIKNIKHETVLKLSNILKCNPAYLMGWVSIPYAEDQEKTVADNGNGISWEEKQLLDLFNLFPAERRAEVLKIFESVLKAQGLL